MSRLKECQGPPAWCGPRGLRAAEVQCRWQSRRTGVAFEVPWFGALVVLVLVPGPRARLIAG